MIKEEGKWECLQVGSQSSLMSKRKSWDLNLDLKDLRVHNVLSLRKFLIIFLFVSLSFFFPFTTSFFLSFPPLSPPPFSLSLPSFSPQPIHFCSEWSRSQCQLGSYSSHSTLNYPVDGQIFEEKKKQTTQCSSSRISLGSSLDFLILDFILVAN